MPIAPGTRLGSYDIVSLLGVGGMGEVYRARDVRLRRDVAIKTLPATLTAERDRLARFEREARVLASLNHPNIATLFAVEEGAEGYALVMELVDGDTLADLIRYKPLSLTEAMSLARQIVDALDAAHEKGIIHRDLKPANIMVTTDRVVKVLDFGLAKAVGRNEALEVDLTQTRAGTPTLVGVIMGTADYMSPEQARGRPVDKRTDIWAFGCVLYEMLAGSAPFARDTPTDTLAAIVDREPDWQALPAGTPHGITRLLKRCLEKEPKHRLRDIADAHADLKDAGSAEAAGAGGGRGRPRAVASMLGAGAVGVVATAAALVLLPGLHSAPDTVPTLSPAVRIVSTRANEFGPALSPDGKWVAYLSDARGPTDVWVKFIAGGDAANLTATTDLVVQSADFIGGLDISPDGTQIAFSATRVGEPQTAQTTWVIPAPLGGTPRPVLVGGSQGMRWSRDGTRIAYILTGGSLGDVVVVADADGQNAREIVARSGARHMHWLRWSADGEYLYFNFGIQNWNIEPTAIYRVRSSGGAIEPAVPASRRAAFPFPAPSGRGLFYSANPDSVELGLWWRDFGTGRDHRLTNGVGEYGAPFVSADGGRLVATAVDPRQTLMRLAVNGSEPAELEPVTDGFTGDIDPVWAPDGSRLYFSSSRSGSRNLWSVAADLSRPTPLTSGTTFDERPFVSPDGRQVAFISEQGGQRGIWTVSANGGTRRQIVAAEVLDTLSWSRDGTRIAYAAPDGDAPGLFAVSVSDGQTSRVATPGPASGPGWSPREDVIAYIEPRGGTRGAQVRFVTADGQPVYTDLPDLPVQVGNGSVVWSADGKWLAVVGLPGNRAGYIWLLDPKGGTPPRRLIELPTGASLRGMTFSRDGSSIIVGFVDWASDIVLFSIAQP